MSVIYIQSHNKRQITGGPEVGIYKRKQESKKTRKQELDQESDQKTRKKRKKELDQESDQEKLSFFLDHFLGQVLVFFLFFLFPCFLTFLLSFINSHLRWRD